MFHRLLNPLQTNSFFIFGARGTGKSTFIQKQFLMNSSMGQTAGEGIGFQGIKVIDLLDPSEEEKYSRRPKQLEAEILAMDPLPQWIFIDEIQKIPKLLNLVHRLIESHGLRFILTGSSARKLKRGAANLLAGRAFVHHMFPLTAFELGRVHSSCPATVEELLNWGSLPKIFSFSSVEEKRAYLRAYALTYLQEEIRSEQLVRNLDPFRAFLEVAAQCNGKILNYSKIAREIGVDSKTVQSYFSILEDTLVGFHLPGFHRSVRKSQAIHPKFYFFDCGVKKALEKSLDALLVPATFGFGVAFEHLVILECQRLNSYTEADYRFSYLRTKDDAEIDLILSKGNVHILIEIKSSMHIDPIEVAKLDRLRSDISGSTAYYLSCDPDAQKLGEVHCLYWTDGIRQIFGIRV